MADVISKLGRDTQSGRDERPGAREPRLHFFNLHISPAPSQAFGIVTFELIMNCQKCRVPLKLDNSLQDLTPATYDLLVGL